MSKCENYLKHMYKNFKIRTKAKVIQFTMN